MTFPELPPSASSFPLRKDAAYTYTACTTAMSRAAVASPTHLAYRKVNAAGPLRRMIPHATPSARRHVEKAGGGLSTEWEWERRSTHR